MKSNISRLKMQSDKIFHFISSYFKMHDIPELFREEELILKRIYYYFFIKNHKNFQII
jgi:hypothetical protein